MKSQWVKFGNKSGGSKFACATGVTRKIVFRMCDGFGVRNLIHLTTAI